MLALEPVPGDAGDARHRAAHLVKHLGYRCIGPGQAELFRDLLNDPQVLPCVARRVERLTAELHQAVGVRERAGLLGERTRRQDHVGEIRRLGQEDVLHDEEIQLGQGLPHLVDVRV